MAKDKCYIWPRTNEKEKAKLIAEWPALKKLREDLRTEHNISEHVPESDVPTYDKIMSKLSEQFCPKEAPAMPVIRREDSQDARDGSK